MKKKKNKSIFLIFFICLFVLFIGLLVFFALYTYNETWTYDDYKIKRIYDNEQDCLDKHSKDDCLDKDYIILKDYK